MSLKEEDEQARNSIERDRYDDDRPTRRYRDDYYDRDRDRGGDGYYESRHYEDSNGRYYDSYRETRVYPR